MCQYVVTEYACGHDLVHNWTKCTAKRNAGPYPHFLPCKTTDPVRKNPGICRDCERERRDAKEAARVANARNSASPSWKSKILAPLVMMFEEHHEVQTTAHGAPPVAVSQETAQFLIHGTGIRAGGPNTWRPRGGRPIPKHDKATSTLAMNAISSLVKEDDEPTSLSEQPLNSQWSWSTEDDLPWQSVEKFVNELPQPPASHLNTLPSQLNSLRMNPPGTTIRREDVQRRLPHLSTTSDIKETQVGGHNERKPNIARKPLPPRPTERYATELAGNAISATRYSAELDRGKVHQANSGSTKRQPLPASASELWDGVQGKLPNPNRLSRADVQDAELFFAGGQCDPETLAALEAGNRAKEVRRTPTILRAGHPNSACISQTVISRPDSTYTSPAVGQVPDWHETSPTDQKSSNRHAKLSIKDEASWEEFVLTYPTTPEMRHAAELPALSFKKKAKESREEIRMSSRISRPGLHDTYTASPKASSAELSAEKGGMAKRKGKLQKKMKSKGQVPRHTDNRSLEPEAACVWDEVVAKACVSLESILSDSST
jgi:hypothetical protein